MELGQVLGLDDCSLVMLGKTFQRFQVTCFRMIGENDVSFSSGSMILELKNESGIPEVVGAGPGGISIDSGKFADIWNPELLGKCVPTRTERQNT